MFNNFSVLLNRPGGVVYMAFNSASSVLNPRYRAGRNISSAGGFVPAGTKFDAIPALRGGEQLVITSDDLYVMRGLFCGEACTFAKHLGKLSLGDAIATAKESAGMLRRMAVYEGCVRPNMGDCPRLPVMGRSSLISSPEVASDGKSAKFYRRFFDVSSKIGALGFPELQKFDCEALWVLNQAQRYCKSQSDQNVLQRLIPKECQPASDVFWDLSEYSSAESMMVMGRSDLYNKLSKVSARSKFACEMSLANLSAKYPGKSARSANAIWTGLSSDKCNVLPDAFLLAWSKSSPDSQARSIAQMVPGIDLDLPVGCIRYTHMAFGRKYQTELPFYDSNILRDWAKAAYAEAVRTATMDKVDVVLPKTVTEQDILPATFSESNYNFLRDERAKSEREALCKAVRDVSDLNKAIGSMTASSDDTDDFECE